MKKLLLFLIILTFAVFCSACINNYAISQLNEIAKQYSDHGDLNAAVARLESSVDLDGNIFETRYNLAVAYMDINECEKALEQINVAQTLLKKEDASIYYVQGVANSCIANKLFNRKLEDGTVEPIVYENKSEELSKANQFVKYLKDANIAFDKYVKMASLTDNTDDIIGIMNNNNAKIQEYSEKYGL